jgi:hypothetical protein
MTLLFSEEPMPGELKFEKFQPTNPSNLTKLNNYNNHSHFSWSGTSAPVDPNNTSLITYNVWRKSGFGSYQQIASGLSSTSFIDYSVLINQSGIRHVYRINANSGDNNIQSPFYSNKIFYNGWLGKEQQEQFTNQIEGFDTKIITTSTMSVKLTNVNALDWYSGWGSGIEWIDGDHDVVFTHGIWLSGMIGDTLVGTTSSWGLDYSPGPIIDGQAAILTNPADSLAYRIYHIDLNSGTGDFDYDEWPVQWGAPDYPDGSPKVYGGQTAYMVYNDAHSSNDLRGFPESDPTPVEIHETVWDHSTDDSNEDEVELENVIFFRYQLYNRGNNDINDAALALWTDIDIYEALSNWGGYNENGNYVFNYFWGDVEEGYLPRACTYVLLQGPLVSDNGETGISFGKEFADKSNLNTTSGWYVVDDIFNSIGDELAFYPDDFEQLRNISLGLMPNGEPIINPITGDTTTYTYDGNPVTNEGWLWDDMGTGGGSGFISSSSTFDLDAGDSTEAIYALVVALGDSFSEALINLEDQVLELKEWWVDNQLGIFDNEKELMPESFKLFNVYPNPFNPSLNIRWQSSLNKEIEINAYNILGQKVESIFSGNSNKSMNQIMWTPENLSSGVYIIEITDQVTSDHQKVILLK